MSALQPVIERAFDARDEIDTTTKGEVRDAVEAALEMLDKGAGREQVLEQLRKEMQLYANLRPAIVFDELADGGRLVTVEGGSPTEPGVAVLYEKLGSHIGRRILFDAGTPLLAGFRQEAGFVF